MNYSDRFASLLADGLDDLAAPSYPDYFDHALARALDRPQRPGWTFLERWIPMSTATRRSVFGPIVLYRQIAILLAVLALIIVGGAIAIIGSRPPITQTHPFGPAENGLVSYAVDGDIFMRDINGGSARLTVGGDAFDVAPTFSRDGTQLAFIRLDGNPLDPTDAVTQEFLYVANADGSSQRNLLSVDTGYAFSWSADGTQLATITADDGETVLSVVDVGDGTVRALSLPVVPVDAVEWRPPDGRELIFHGRDGVLHAIYAVRPDGTGLRRISGTANADTSFFPSGMGYSISPDDQTLLYTQGGTTVTMRQLDLNSGEDTQWGAALPAFPGKSPGGQHWGHAVFSPDGSQVVFGRYWDQRDNLINHQVFIATFASNGAGAEPLNDVLRSAAGRNPFDYGFSPDGTSVIIRYFDTDQTLLIDLGTMETQTLPWGVVTDYPSWQRRP